MILNYTIIVILVAFSALFSGLNLGLMSLDVYGLKRKMELGDKNAARVYSIRKKGNLLLCTILLGNIAVNSVIAIMLESIAGGLMAGILATAIIFIFGEVLPQSVVSRFALRFGSITAPLMKLIIFILYPITAPIAYILDRLLGSELPTIYSRDELTRLVAEHEDHPASTIDADEERIIHGALQYSEKKVADVMTPVYKIISVNTEDRADRKLLEKIKSSGRSRFPVTGKDGKKIIGLLYTKDLAGTIFDGSKSVSDLIRTNVILVKETDKLDNILNKFLETRLHLFVVEDARGNMSGIVTIEDVIEEILKREIIDESEKHHA
ncbi:MAG: CNNM domain-containing protein [Candidatus Paceibacterota bacterium]